MKFTFYCELSICFHAIRLELVSKRYNTIYIQKRTFAARQGDMEVVFGHLCKKINSFSMSWMGRSLFS